MTAEEKMDLNRFTEKARESISASQKQRHPLRPAVNGNAAQQAKTDQPVHKAGHGRKKAKKAGDKNANTGRTN